MSEVFGYPTDDEGNIQFLIVEAPDVIVENFQDYLTVMQELFRIATEDYPGCMPILRLHYGD